MNLKVPDLNANASHRRWTQLFLPLIATLMMGALIWPAPAGDTGSDERWQAWTGDQFQSEELIGRIWSSRAQSFVPPSQLLEAVAEAQFVLLGENHDNAAHHHLQGWIIEKAHIRDGFSVVMEQIHSGKSEALRAFMAQAEPDPRLLGEALDWAESGWPDWDLYLPIAQAAIARKATILPGLPTAEQTRQIAREGLDTLGSDRVSQLQLDTPLPVAETEALREEIAAAHCDLLPTKALPAMQGVQRFRDAFMAEAMLNAAQNTVQSTMQNGGARGAVVLISGNGHVNKNRGVPWYLRQAGAEKVLVIAMTETRPGTRSVADAISEVDVADYFWFTPGVDRGDPCASLRERFKQD
jgi:uncharacterized iron-regulated protein